MKTTWTREQALAPKFLEEASHTHVHVRRRQYEPGRWTNDIYVWGFRYVTAIGTRILESTIERVRTHTTTNREAYQASIII
jgi:hypothetical protein